MSTILVGVRVNASASKAFELFTEHPHSWWLANDLFEFSSRGLGHLSFVGGERGKFIERYDDGSTFVIGDILDWQPGRSLMFTWRQETFPTQTETLVQVLFTPLGESTRVNVLHKGWGKIDPKQAAKSAEVASTFLPTLTQWWQESMASYEAAAHIH